MEISHFRKTVVSDRNISLAFNASFKHYGIFFFVFILLILLSNPVYATDDSNQPEPNTIEELFGPNVNKYSLRDRVDIIIRILEKESVEESMERLYEYDLYMWPGTCWTVSREYSVNIPLPETTGQNEILHILGNRRFLRLIDGLSKLPKEKAADLVSKEIKGSLEEHKRLLDEYLIRYGELLRKDPKIRQENRELIGFHGTIGRGRPTLLAMHYKVLALVLIAGNLELKQSQPAVEKVLEAAIEQRNKFYNKELWYEQDAFSILMMGSLYNRQVLGIGVLGTSTEPNQVQEILNKAGCKMVSERLTKFDSPVAVYDYDSTRFPRRPGEAADYSKGEITVKYLEPLTDSAFDKLISAIKAEQQKPNNPKDANKTSNPQNEIR